MRWLGRREKRGERNQDNKKRGAKEKRSKKGRKVKEYIAFIIDIVKGDIQLWN